jgi:hypothetical protein
MGQTARERGFTGKFLSELCDPSTGLDAGCELFAHKFALAEGNLGRALALWNGGTNPEYPAQVLARVRNYSALGSPA